MASNFLYQIIKFKIREKKFLHASQRFFFVSFYVPALELAYWHMQTRSFSQIWVVHLPNCYPSSSRLIAWQAYQLLYSINEFYLKFIISLQYLLANPHCFC